jgi:vacuolar-type H+-ATPase subunit I/STV1
MISVIKEFLEIPRRRILRVSVGKPDSEINHVINKIQKTGFFKIQKYWKNEKVISAKEAIDNLCKIKLVENSWVDSKKSDHRFFFAEKHNQVFEDLRSDLFIEKVRKHYTGRKYADKCVLAAKLLSQPGNKGSGGGWHMDSPFSMQFKAFLFLTDVNHENGPLEVILQTRKNLVRFGLEISGLKKVGQYRFSDEEAEKIQNKVGAAQVFTAKAGDLVLADVSALHRGRPIESGFRYALTLYCGDPNIAEKLA